jgi:predicted PurR-regulated permease PerM
MDVTHKDIIAIRRLLTYFAGLSILYLLYLLQQVLIPFVLALFIALLVYPVLEFLDKKKVPIWLSITMIWIVIIASIFFLGWVFYSTGLSFYDQREVLFLQLQHKLNAIIAYLNNQYQLQIDISDVMQRVQERLNSSFLIAQTTNFAGTLGGVVGVFSMVSLYLIILMSGILSYENYFRYLEQDKKQGKILQAFDTVKKSITTYMRVKFILSICTGIGTAVVCSLLHIKFAIFWGFLAYLLNFIPTFGSILGVVPPVLMSLIQFDSMMYVLLVLALLFAVQTLFGNILEPIYMGSSVSINTIAIIMGLLFWGYLWGVYGMFLAVPLLVMVKTILEQIEGAEVLARLMGTHVKVKKKN